MQGAPQDNETGSLDRQVTRPGVLLEIASAVIETSRSKAHNFSLNYFLAKLHTATISDNLQRGKIHSFFAVVCTTFGYLQRDPLRNLGQCLEEWD